MSKRTPLLHPLFSSIALFNVGTYLCNNCNHCAEVDFPFFRKLFFTSFSSIIIVIGGPEMAMIKRKRKEMSANSIIRFDLTNFSSSLFSKKRTCFFTAVHINGNWVIEFLHFGDWKLVRFSDQNWTYSKEIIIFLA